MDEPPDSAFRSDAAFPRSRLRWLHLVFVAGTALLLFLASALNSPPIDVKEGTHVRIRRHDVENDSIIREQSGDDEHYFLRMLQQQDVPQNCTLECCQAFESDICGSDNQWISAVPFAVQIILIVVLVCLSAMFSGLTLGLLGLDMTGLEIIMEGDNEKNIRAAKRIYTVRKNGNLLLCTLLIGNVAVNAMLSILLADKAGGIVGFLASTALITVFGEITPQAVCSRYALEVGYVTTPLVRVFVFLLYPVAKPLSMCLDCALGEELATTYSNAEMRKLLEIHVKEGRFDQETAGAMQGALQYKEIPVKQVMTPLEHVFMLDVDNRLNFSTIATIFKSGFSRIPVYEVSVNNVIGLLFVKDLIFVDPEDDVPVRNFVQLFGRGVHVVWPDDKLGDVLRELKQGRSHMAIVRDVNNEDETRDPFYEVKGIITLEDIIEEILGDEIVDETDAFVDHTHSVKVNRKNFDWGRLRLLDAKLVDETLSYEEAKAVVAHLRTNYKDTVSFISDHQLYRFVSSTPVSELPTAEQELGELVPNDLLYEKGKPSDTCTLILSGKVTVLAGADQFRSDVSSWSVLAASSLTDPSYTPDFTAFVSGGPCRCLCLTREGYTAAVDASALEKRGNSFGGSAGGDDSGKDNSSNAKVMDIKRQSPERRMTSSEAESEHKHGAATQKRRTKLIEALQNARSVRFPGGGGKDSEERSSPTPEEPGPRGSSVTPDRASVEDGNGVNGTDGGGESFVSPFEYIDSSRGPIQDGDDDKQEDGPEK